MAKAYFSDEQILKHFEFNNFMLFVEPRNGTSLEDYKVRIHQTKPTLLGRFSTYLVCSQVSIARVVEFSKLFNFVISALPNFQSCSTQH